MINDLQKRLFTSILQNSYFDKLYKLWMESFFKIKTLKSPKKVIESFFGIKNFKTVMVSFFRIKNLKSRKKATESFFQY